MAHPSFSLLLAIAQDYDLQLTDLEAENHVLRDLLQVHAADLDRLEQHLQDLVDAAHALVSAAQRGFALQEASDAKET